MLYSTAGFARVVAAEKQILSAVPRQPRSPTFTQYDYEYFKLLRRWKNKMGATQMPSSVVFFFFFAHGGRYGKPNKRQNKCANKLGLISPSRRGGCKHFARRKALGRRRPRAKVNTSSRLFPFHKAPRDAFVRAKHAERRRTTAVSIKRAQPPTGARWWVC